MSTKKKPLLNINRISNSLWNIIRRVLILLINRNTQETMTLEEQKKVIMPEAVASEPSPPSKEEKSDDSKAIVLVVAASNKSFKFHWTRITYLNCKNYFNYFILFVFSNFLLLLHNIVYNTCWYNYCLYI